LPISQAHTPSLIHQQGIICGVAFDRFSLRRMKSHGLRHKAQGLRLKENKDGIAFPLRLAPCASRIRLSRRSTAPCIYSFSDSF
jgi:hypothetical protein